MSEIHAINKLYKDRRRKIGDALTMILKADDIATTEMIAEQDKEIDKLTTDLATANKRVTAEREACCKDVCAWCEKVGQINDEQEIKPATLTDNEQYEHVLIWDTDGNEQTVRCQASHIRIREHRATTHQRKEILTTQQKGK